MKKRIHRFLASIKHRVEEWMDNNRYLRYLNTLDRRNIYVIGTPTHSNVGDNAIAYAEILFLEACGFHKKHIKEITVDEYRHYEKLIVKRLSRKKRVIFMHGGGNMGNQWPGEEQFRRNVMAQLPKNPMIILPQTFSYSNDEAGQRECEKSVPCYNGRKGLTIVARERVSFEQMKKCYPDTNVLLTPDIVLSMDPKGLQLRQQKRQGALLVFRQDGEKVLTDEEASVIRQAVESMGIPYRITDMLTERQTTKENRQQILEEKLNEFAGAEIVITDRLHAMVFAAISGTACVVMKNNNHKITGTYAWIRDLPHIQFAENVQQAAELVAKLRSAQQHDYDHTALSGQFDGLRAVIQEATLTKKG